MSQDTATSARKCDEVGIAGAFLIVMAGESEVEIHAPATTARRALV
jgi:hypothetical protein